MGTAVGTTTTTTGTETILLSSTTKPTDDALAESPTSTATSLESINVFQHAPPSSTFVQSTKTKRPAHWRVRFCNKATVRRTWSRHDLSKDELANVFFMADELRMIRCFANGWASKMVDNEIKEGTLDISDRDRREDPPGLLRWFPKLWLVRKDDYDHGQDGKEIRECKTDRSNETATTCTSNEDNAVPVRIKRLIDSRGLEALLENFRCRKRNRVYTAHATTVVSKVLGEQSWQQRSGPKDAQKIANVSMRYSRRSLHDALERARFDQQFARRLSRKR